MDKTIAVTLVFAVAVVLLITNGAGRDVIVPALVIGFAGLIISRVVWPRR